MPLSWNEIKARASSFSHNWKDTVREEADAKPFLVAFLDIFGISQKRVATFEHRVQKLGHSTGYIDLLWPGNLLVEMKSRGHDLEKAYIQAKEYCHGLKEYELPKLIMVSDFHTFNIYTYKGQKVSFELPQLVENLQVFEELAGYQKREYHEENPVNIEAAELMGKLHDHLKEAGYTGTALEVYLVRLLFILFADDSTIWQTGIFLDYLELRTHEDGSDLAMHLDQLFQVLDTPEDKRLRTLDEQLNMFPYVNGRLFTERLPTAAFDKQMRQILLDCCRLDWGKISPAIFGSLFQSVMDAEHRRNLGAHYTSEKNIMKVIKPLFLDELWEEFYSAGENHHKLKALHGKISKLRFLDPACGCGNFLITAYRELRLLELGIVEKLLKGQQVLNINQYFLVDLDQFYGIEIGEFASQIAQVAMFLIDHQCNMLVSEKFGEYIPLIPLQKSAIIVQANALRLDWQSIIRPFEGEVGEPRFNYILGNPPFVGKQFQTKQQKEDLASLLGNVKGAGVLDYVTAWYECTARYIGQSCNTEKSLESAKGAFVSTNSISQGEQVGILWRHLFKTYKLKILFAHGTFKWGNEAKGNAGVFCVVIGFGLKLLTRRTIYRYDDISGEPVPQFVSNINPYLVEGRDDTIGNRTSPLCDVPNMTYGSFALDDGNLTISEKEYNDYMLGQPETSPFFRPFIGGKEFLYSIRRYCIWLDGIDLKEIRHAQIIIDRVKRVKDWRGNSNRETTRKLAASPAIFAEIRQPDTRYLALPTLSSEYRKYIPIGFLESEVIASNQLYVIPDARSYHFGLLTSEMHMIWIKYVCGKLEGRYRYSSSIVYNNFPWPKNPTDAQKKTVEQCAENVLKARELFPGSSLADLYDPLTMPPALLKAHQELDRAVDRCYRPQPFADERVRIEYLFQLYAEYVGAETDSTS